MLGEHSWGLAPRGANQSSFSNAEVEVRVGRAHGTVSLGPYLEEGES